MDADNLIFSSKINPQVEEVCFNILLEQFSEENFDRVYVKNVAIAPNEIIFFVKIDDSESIIRVPIQND
jgi:hypothetical protein